MLLAALHDLRWRRRRFVIAILGTSLVFGMTLLMSGVAHGFDAETTSTVQGMHADGWVVRRGAAGPFLGAAPMAQSEAEAIGHLRGVRAAAATLFTRKSVQTRSGVDIDVNIFGSTSSSIGMPAPDEGRAPVAADEALISSRLSGYHVGDVLGLAGARLRVVGIVHGSTALGGTPNVFLTIAGVQQVGYGGQPVASAIAVVGHPVGVPAAYALVGSDVARTDLLRAIAKAKTSITLVSVLLWIVAASIIGAVVYLSSLERQRDFAVFKATGVATSSLLGGLVLQAALMSIVAALGGSVFGVLLAPRFPMLVAIPATAHLLLPAIATAIGLVASLAGVRRAITVDPALAFGGP
jgi:putative ABC transport system permease protein